MYDPLASDRLRPFSPYLSELAQWALLGQSSGGSAVTVTAGGSGPLVGAQALNTAAITPQARQQQIAGVGQVLRILYGQVRLGADIALIRYVNDVWYLLAVWGKGPLGGVQQYWVNDAAPDASVTATHYTGTLTQTPDPTLQALLAAEGKVYADALPGVAYSVFAIPAAACSGFPILAALLNGRALYDSRADSTNGGSGTQRLATPSTWAYSDNPALALADFRCQFIGRTMNWASVATTANACDDLLGVSPKQEKRRLIALALERAQSPSQWTDTLRTYAGCMVIPDAGGEIIAPLKDAAGTTSMSFTHANIVAGTLKWKKRGIQQVPRYVEVQFTDTGSTPYIAGFATATAPGLTWATAAPSKISLTGITRYSQAYREAIERLNQFLLADLSVTFASHDERALKLQVGTLIDVTSSVYGWASKLFRVDTAPAIKSGAGLARYDISAVEYDPAVYSDVVSANPTTPDTTLGSPTNPPAITGLSVTEEPYLEQYAVTATQARLTWTRPVWPFLAGYWVTADIEGVRQWETLVLPSGNATDEAVSPKLRTGELYSFGVAARSSVATGARTYVGLRPLGKSAPPSDVTSISGFTVGGDTFLDWTEATDDDQIHIRYELRYGATSGSWESANVLDKLAALHKQVAGVPIGTWRFWVKAIDSIGQYSANAAYVDLTVTDSGSYATVTTVLLSGAGTALMEPVNNATCADDRYVASTNRVMGYGHVDTNDATGLWIDANISAGALFASPLDSASLGASWYATQYDAGSMILANWAAAVPYRDLSGTAARLHIVLYNASHGLIGDYTGGSALGIAAQYATVVISGYADSIFAVDGPATLTVVQPGMTQLVLNPNATGSGTNQRSTITQAPSQAAELSIVLPPAAPTVGQALLVTAESSGSATTDWGDVARIVATNTHTGLTAALGSTAAYTLPAADGFYEIGVYGCVTTVATGGTIAAFLQWTDADSNTAMTAAVVFQLVATTLGWAPASATNANVRLAKIKASTAINISTTFNAVTGAPVYNLYAVVKKV